MYFCYWSFVLSWKHILQNKLLSVDFVVWFSIRIFFFLRSSIMSLLLLLDFQTSLWRSPWLFVFIFGCAGSSLLQTTLCCGARVSRCCDLFRCRARTLGEQASLVAAHGFSSCSSPVLFVPGIWSLPGSGLESVTSALAGGFLFTVLPGKSVWNLFWRER